MVTLHLPYPPTVNTYWRANGNRRFICKAGQEFRQAVCEIVAEMGVNSLVGRLCVEIELSPPDKRRRDLDNVLKAVLDGMEHAGVYADDSYIDRIVVTRTEVMRGGRCVVRVFSVDPLRLAA